MKWTMTDSTGRMVSYQRLWVFLVVLCFGASVLVALCLMAVREDGNIGNLILIPAITAVSIPVTYLVAAFLHVSVRLGRWVRASYEPDDWRVVKGVFRGTVVVMVALIVATLYRYEIIAWAPGQSRFAYLLWDRWTGTTEARSVERPDSADYGRQKNGYGNAFIEDQRPGGIYSLR